MPRTKLQKGSVSVTFRLPQEVQRRLLEKARSQKISFSELLRRALRREIGSARALRTPRRIIAGSRRRRE